jgi:hypothetical protein
MLTERTAMSPLSSGSGAACARKRELTSRAREEENFIIVIVVERNRLFDMVIRWNMVQGGNIWWCRVQRKKSKDEK